MAGLKIRICFWYLDPQLVEHVILALKEGKFDVNHLNVPVRRRFNLF